MRDAPVNWPVTAHLDFQTGLGIVGQAMVLSALVSEFCLQEEILAVTTPER